MAAATTIPTGFRAAQFRGEGSDVVYDGIVRLGAETWSGGLMPFVTVATAQTFVDREHALMPTPEVAHGMGVAWYDLVPMLGDWYDLVVYEPDNEGLVNGYVEGFPVDSGAWGTLNLLDELAYERVFPGREWVDLGALGLVWHEVRP